MVRVVEGNVPHGYSADFNFGGQEFEKVNLTWGLHRR